MDGEIWRDVRGFEGIYCVSNLGRIKAYRRDVKVCGGGIRTIEEHIVKPMRCSNGYLEVSFSVKRKRTVRLLHRVVAEAFLPNPNNLPEVNHRDEDITNCHVDNLEWCTSKYNANYGTRNQRMMVGRVYQPVWQKALDGRKIKRYERLTDAWKETGADISSIIRVCKGKQHTALGYQWEYAE